MADDIEKIRKEKLAKRNFVPATKYKRIRQESLCLSTGIFPIDFATGEIDDQGFAGIRQRDIFEVLGLNNSLKTAVGLSMLGATQKRFGPQSAIAVFTEPFDPDRLEQAGIDLDGLMVYDLYDPEENGLNIALMQPALQSILEMCMDEDFDIQNVLIDSVANFIPDNAMWEKAGKLRELGNTPVAAAAKLFNDFVCKYKLVNRKAVLTCINHKKVKVNTGFSGYENQIQIETPCGRGMEFMGDVRMECSATADKTGVNTHSSPVVDEKIAKGYNAIWKLFKNKYANKTNSRVVRGNFNFKEARWNNEEQLIEVASFFAYQTKDAIETKMNMMKVSDKLVYSPLSPLVYKNAAAIRIGEESFRGIANAAQYLKDNPQVYEILLKQLYPLHDQFFLDEKPTAESIMDD